MGCNCGKSKKNINLANKIENIMAKKKVLYRIKEDSTLTIDSYFRFRGGEKIWVKGITQDQLATLYRNGFTDVEIVEAVKTKSKDDKKEINSK